jgi:hypothetical protein
MIGGVRRRRTDVWGWIAWIVVALAVWVAVAAFVGVLLGRAIRRRDRQIPGGDAVEVFPPPRAPADDPVPERRPRA